LKAGTEKTQPCTRLSGTVATPKSGISDYNGRGSGGKPRLVLNEVKKSNQKKQDMESAKVYTLKDSIEYSQGATVSKIVTRGKNGSATLFSFDKGQQLSEHTTPYDAIAVIVDGTCAITIAGKAHVLTEGQLILMPANIPHALEATQAFKMMLLMIKA
jgi:quercetin dioxygenase-like cupin family protein